MSVCNRHVGGMVWGVEMGGAREERGRFINDKGCSERSGRAYCDTGRVQIQTTEWTNKKSSFPFRFLGLIIPPITLIGQWAPQTSATCPTRFNSPTEDPLISHKLWREAFFGFQLLPLRVPRAAVNGEREGNWKPKVCQRKRKRKST